MIDQVTNLEDGDLALPAASLDLSTRMRDLRARQGLKQSEVARRMRLDPSIPSLWEQGKRLVPANRVRALAEALEVSVEELLDGVSGAQRPTSSAVARTLPDTTSRGVVAELVDQSTIRPQPADSGPLLRMMPSLDDEPASRDELPIAQMATEQWIVPERPPLDGWIPDGWQPTDRIQDISPSLPDGYWLDPVKLERMQARQLLRSRLCSADRSAIGDRDVPGAALVERLYRHCSKEDGFGPNGRLPLAETIFRCVVAADHGGLTDGALVEMLRERASNVPVSTTLLRRLRDSVRVYPIRRVDADLFGGSPVALLLSRGELARLLSFDRVIEAVAQAFAAYSGGQTVTPLRVGVEPPGTDGVLLAMPSAVVQPEALGAKIVSVFRGNPARGLPTVTSIYVLSDYATGAPLAIMDGSYLTAIRTAAGSAVATRSLARADARSLGVFGTGVQARFHVETIRRVRALEVVVVCGTSAAKSASFATWVTETTGVAARAASAQDVSDCDIVAACTTSATPVVVADAVRDGAHVNAVGAFTPTTRELPSALIDRARVYVDTRAGALSEAGDLIIAQREGAFSELAGEVGEVLLGAAHGRTSDQEVTVYKSVGAAFLDAATARLAFDEATRHQAGTVYAFDHQ